MSKKKDKDLELGFEESFIEAEPVAPEKKEAAPPELMLSFDRYFSTLGRPDHHKAGMKAFLKKGQAQGKKAKSYWEQLFKTY